MVSKRGISVCCLVTLMALPGITSIVNAQPFAASLERVGPIDPANGFPMWYEDQNGLILELCTDPGMCFFLLPDVLSPVSFPDNYPDEAFWWGADSIMETNGGGQALLVLALEAAFDGVGEVVDGMQISFARLRLRVDNLVAGASYTITTPYEVTTLSADGTGVINHTDDRGFGGGDFSGALNGGIGPFLRWDPAVPPAAPAGFIGDGGTPHPIIGSPNGTNYFRIEGPSVGAAGSPYLCTDPALGPDPASLTDCIETNLFSVMGKIATRFGVGAERASYTRTGAGTQVSVWARSGDGLSLVASDDGLTEHALVENPLVAGQYYCRFSMTNAAAPPSTIMLTNLSDIPPTTVTVPVVDEVSITEAVYDADSKIVTVRGLSGNNVEASSLSAGFGLEGLGGGPLDATGTLTVTGVVVPPPSVKLSSSFGGAMEIPIKVVGLIPSTLADAGGNQVVDRLGTAILDGNGSTGASSYLWELVASDPTGIAVTMTGANTPVAGFTFPDQDALLTFRLTISDGAGATSTDLATVTNTVIADAGLDQNVLPEALVQLDGGGSQGYGLAYSWSQLGGDALVALDDPTISNPSFLFPIGALVATLQLTVTGPGGTSASTINITSSPAAAPAANAGADQAVLPGERVQLNGSGSIGDIDIFTWTQTAGTPVFLGILQPDGTLAPGGESVPNPVFDFPAAPDTLAFQLTVTGPAGSSSASVTITGQDPNDIDDLTILQAEFRADKAEWRIEGTSSIPGPGHTVTIYCGPDLNGQVIGSAVVDALGAWTVRERDSSVPLDPTETISVASSLGGILLGVPVEVR